jgi:CheY-like chemotaxis protein
MAAGGTLTLRTRRLEQPWAEIVVEDTGVGMPPGVLKKAMEPFFTTKPPGKGTGLGLAMVFNAARAHGGSLTLTSQEGRGTQARLRLPCLAAGATPSADPETVTSDRKGMRILMVDDDDLLRAAVPDMLQALGHQVEAVDGGKAALAFLGRRAIPDLVILDMNMPDMTGMETLQRIRIRHPSLPVLFATGYLDPALEAAIEAIPHTMAITKPFSLKEIQSTLLRLKPVPQ